MHHGIIAAEATAEALVDALNKHVSRLELGDRHGRLEEMNLEPDATGWPMAMGCRDGRTYLLDTSMVLSASQDMIPALSVDLRGATVVGCGAETTSGSYWLIAARDGKTIRSHWNCFADMRRPWSKGEPLATEALLPLADLDGVGLRAAFGGLGFDYDGWVANGPYQAVCYVASDFPASGPLAAEFGAFYESVRIPEGMQPKPVVVARAGGGFDLVAGGSPPARDEASASRRRGACWAGSGAGRER